MNITGQLLDKYSQPVPRYTSYPPANFFEEGANHQRAVEMILQSNQDEPRNISLYIHIPFCNKICHYCGCNSMKKMSPSMVSNYLDAVKQELRMFRRHIEKGRKVSQVHWGGGTPNSLEASEIKEVMDQLYRDFEFIEKPEIAIECNPAGLDKAYIEELHNSGFNRVSLGIQDFNTGVLNAVNREIPGIRVEQLIEWLRLKPGLKVNLDFIFGLPLQTPEGFAKSIQRAAEMNPDRLVTFSYAHVPWFRPAQKILEKYGLPGPEEKLRLFETARGIIEREGYRSVGLDHFAKPDDELFLALEKKSLHRNFQGYCTRETTGQVYASGISSISQYYGGYIQNTKSIEQYIKILRQEKFAVEKFYLLSKDELVVRTVINELMCNLFLDWDRAAGELRMNREDVIKITGLDFRDLQGFAEDGLLNYDENRIEISESGKYFVRNIAAAFDPKLRNSGKKFSKSV